VKVLEENPVLETTLSLRTRTVTCGEVPRPFEVNDDFRWRVISGYDDIDVTLHHEDDIGAYEKMRAEKFPFKPKTILAIHWAEDRIESIREPEEVEATGPLADCGII
jgi:3-isopropylmalate dehydratase small subunit